MADPFVTLNGEAGEFFSRADVNILDADSAHLQQSQGLWINQGSGISIGLDAIIPPVFGDTHGFIRASAGTTFFGTSIEPEQIEIVGNVPSSYVGSVGASFDGSVFVTLTFFEGDSQIGTSESVVIDVTAGEFFPFVINATPNIAADSVQLQIRKDGNANDLEEVYWDAITFSQDTRTEFIPSLRIVGDLDMTANAAAVDWEIASGLISTDSGVTPRGYIFHASSAGDRFRLQVPSVDGSVHVDYFSAFMTRTGGQLYKMRATRIAATGDAEFYLDDVSIGTVGGTSGAMFPVDTAAQIGVTFGALQGPFHGDIFSAEIRDGIDGPIVYHFDAADVLASVT